MDGRMPHKTAFESLVDKNSRSGAGNLKVLQV